MSPTPRKNERTLQQRSLGRQLLLSHLSVAAVGLAILCIALISTFELRARVNLLVNEGVPLMQASSQMLTGVQHSLANLRGWVSLNDQKFLDDWQVAWREDIQPALALLNQECRRVLEQACDLQRLQNLKALLADLRESQWWVQDIAHTPGNDPARVAYLLDVEPSADKLNSVIAALLQEEIAQDGGSERKILLARLAELQNAFATTHLLLREILGSNGLNYEEQFRQQLERTTATVAQLTTSPLPTPEQSQFLNLLRMELRAFTQFAQEVIRIRRSPNWNIAIHTLAQETDPLANQVIALASALAANSRMRLEQEAEAASAASSMTVGNLIALIFIMLGVAYVLSKQRAEFLALPLIALSKATRRLTNGGLNEDIPVERDDEIGELTRSFNTMRASMQQAHAELREANVLLEQRVSERTAQLAATNDSLTWEIAEHQQTEKALRESEARLLAITKAIPDLVFVVDEDGCYREILAARRDQIAIGPLRGKLLSQVHSPEMAEFFLDIIRRALATQRIQIAEYELATPSGLRWFESRTAPLEVQFDAKSAAIVVARDITQRKQSEAQLRQAQKMQAIGQLTGGIAHDFNNLLAIIMGNLELLHEQLTAQPRLHQLTQQALKAVDRGANLSRRLLAFARRQPLLAQPTDLNQRVLGMLDLMRRTLGATIQIDTILATNLEQTLIDPDQFENALLNLVINARDAMPQGGRLTLETANVQLDADYAAHEDVRPGSYVMLTVSDTGIGMTPAVLEHVFEPFFTTKETGKGSGLGLSMVYGLVKQSGGHITIYSEPGQGATVRLYLPPTVSAATPAAEPLPIADSAIQGQGEIILVVEDDADVRLFAVNALQGMGYEIQQAGEAETAIRLLERTPRIALLFTDIVLPGEMDGARLAAEAQRRYPGLRVLFTSGYTEHALIGSGQLAEGVDVLTKPYRKAELGKKLRTLLERGETGNG
ncbi:ATP-binding protein [Candidatus Contendibacter odensensis]|uniref:histidine kinase n=1 Tax=Candidatus Contendobacter odensis Run_B_J11 TaxID=1400861 RepID=A0A7U7G9A1_9GAMM|nr:ATP-binding protein [Candidatus Contendobacter odensis]MBK8751493.1 response regulator [Candidatus Competibacteraceae bacterium]CDH43562.1 putative Histidine kinase [Candidatus Contendobacter odensis Run_B_J11]